METDAWKEPEVTNYDGEAAPLTVVPEVTSFDNLMYDGKDDVISMGVSRDDVVIVLSGLYGILLVVIGLVLPIAEAFIHTDTGQNYLFEFFYLYVYTASLAFLLFIYVFLLRSEPLPVPFWFHSMRTWVRSRIWDAELDTNDTVVKKPIKKISFEGATHETGSFFLRLGAVGFGIGSMILDALYFGQYFEIGDHHRFCLDATQILKPSIKFCFSFSQLFFLFRNSKVSILQHSSVARFGFMHMSATNVCVWFRVIVVETLHSIHSHQKSHHYTRLNSTREERNESQIWTNSEMKLSYFPALPELSCQWSNLIGQVLRSASPYLYPFTIEYSVICAGIFFVMWQNVGIGSKRSTDHSDVSHKHLMSVDCASSSRGLFLGILTFIASVVSIILFSVVTETGYESHMIVLIVYLIENISYIFMIIATIIAVWRMRHLRFSRTLTDELEVVLALLSFSGLFMFSVFSIFAGIHVIDTLDGVLTIITNIFATVQATLQTMLLIMGMGMSAGSQINAAKKAGREFVTFLLLCNITMWGNTTFQIKNVAHNPVQLQFYGPEAWGIFTHISVPLSIFFRFHSTVCLSHIWKHAWKVKQL
ncbi:otopetrin-2-like [Mizuhopecten yessoensis]|uniref:Otopetrin-2 n=1 Tax=Mizuhopecten yessoensis TaxID=6573 RepID=A0A210QXF9_MIZYE|nr:otopetrin-2-like [Mizuhopecten yessoensis]OWF53428.1 Otopetrin-2 [Mizuhopecten yessoensis]